MMQLCKISISPRWSTLQDSSGPGAPFLIAWCVESGTQPVKQLGRCRLRGTLDKIAGVLEVTLAGVLRDEGVGEHGPSEIRRGRGGSWFCGWAKRAPCSGDMGGLKRAWRDIALYPEHERGEEVADSGTISASAVKNAGKQV